MLLYIEPVPAFLKLQARSDLWTTLITNTEYLSGLLTLDYSLKKSGSKYPLVALYTDTFPEEGHKALDAPGILKQRAFTNDPRFYDCWSKLTPFSLVEYERVVQLDSDMLVLQNMDELMELNLDPPSQNGEGNRDPQKLCLYNPALQSRSGANHRRPLGYSPGNPNGGLQVVNPSKGVYDKIIAQLAKADTSSYDFADQSLLGDLFHGRSGRASTLRWEGVHDAIWRDDRVKNVHYILSPKPWTDGSRVRLLGVRRKETKDPAHKWWHSVNEERLEAEERAGLRDGF
ncbi:hypothetical protein N7470_004886 [Penicillium chermesinum]|nr:hypothetical protein N7470_004886 [Penicillium chermesinum]